MLNKKKIIIALATAGLLTAGAAQAALVDRGGGMLYDDVLNITWLQDANYAKTSGYDADGLMNWSGAKAWADSLVYGGYSDWRLASNSAVAGEGPWDYNVSFDGTTDLGWNIYSQKSEMSYMYYVNLELKALVNADGSIRTDWGIFRNGTMNGINGINGNWDLSSFAQADIKPVKNLQAHIYWSGTSLSDEDAFSFEAFYGTQYQGIKDQSEFYAWAVRSGDVAAVQQQSVPEPMSLALVGLGLAGVLLARRSRNLSAS